MKTFLTDSPHERAEARELRPDYYKVEVVVTGVSTGETGDDYVATVECFDLIDVLGLGYYAGNALKYLFRWGRKGKDQAKDLRKSLTFLQQSIIRECKETR